MTGSHIILATAVLSNGFSAPVVRLADSFTLSSYLAPLKHITPLLLFSTLWFFCCCCFQLLPFDLTSFFSPHLCLYDHHASSTGYFFRPPSCSAFPPINVSPAWFSIDEYSLRWGWPEVSEGEPRKLMRIVAWLFAWGGGGEVWKCIWEREQARARETDTEIDWQVERSFHQCTNAFISHCIECDHQPSCGTKYAQPRARLSSCQRMKNGWSDNQYFQLL